MWRIVIRFVEIVSKNKRRNISKKVSGIEEEENSGIKAKNSAESGEE